MSIQRCAAPAGEILLSDDLPVRRFGYDARADRHWRVLGGMVDFVNGLSAQETADQIQAAWDIID